MTPSLKKNILLVILDTHRFDRLGSYGYNRNTSPNLDHFASEGIIFEKAIAPGQWTIPSHASLFSGEVPAVHRTFQADDALPMELPTLAKRLSMTGMTATGFCNNPLVGVIQNGFKRGFDKFYNYCGVVPSTPQKVKEDFWGPFRKLWTRYTQLLRRLSYPIQNAFASPNEFFLAALRPFFVPVWTRAGNFKGMTERSIIDATAHIQKIEMSQKGGHFTFLNLMETHLPYAPPENFVKAFAPYFDETPEAKDFMRGFNRKAMQWLIPLEKPFTELEVATLSDIYDAEVAYQDHLLRQLLSSLDTPYHRENSMVIFLADHGEMLGEHGLMGHGFGVYEELIHVPLFMRVPGIGKPGRVSQPVSITKVFHTILDFLGYDSVSMPYADEVDIRSQSLLSLVQRKMSSDTSVISEAYPPENAIRIMEHHKPELLKRTHAEFTQRAVYQGDEKMISVEGISRVLYNLSGDPGEFAPYQDHQRLEDLTDILDAYLEVSSSRRIGASRKKIGLKDDLIQQRLRDLGYLE